MGAGTSSGKTGTASVAAAGNGTATGSILTQTNTPQQIALAKSAIAGIKNAKYQNVTVTRPKDGHRLEIDVQRVKQPSGYPTKYAYRITIDDHDNINEYGNPERLWYTYRNSLADAKKDARRYLGI